MLDLADITLLLSVAVVALLHNFFYLRPRLRRHAQEARKYRLFAVRDHLIALVAEEKVREDSFAFQSLYKFANFLVNRPERLDLATFIMTMEQAKAKGLNPGPDDKRLREEVEANKDLAAVVMEFYKAILHIMLANSLLLRVLVRCRSLFPAKRDGKNLPPAVPPVQRQAYEMYKTYDRASQRLSAVG